MFKTNEDCYYFLTSTCAKGATCTYRHSPLALTCNVICPAWLRGNCPDPACPFRHSRTLPRSSVGIGVPCFYENTSKGCLKPECTFIHSRPRVNFQNSPTIQPANLITNETNKPIVNTPTPPPPAAAAAATTTPSIDSNASLSHETSTNTPTKELESSEIIARRVAVSTDIESLNEKKNSSDNDNNSSNSLSTIKSTNRSIITNSPKANQEESTTQSRLIVNRSVVLSETAPVSPSRTIVQTSTTTNRIVVSSNNTNTTVKHKKNELDVVDEQIQTKKRKQDIQPIIDIPFPCSAPSLTNRLLLSSSKEPATNNDTKPIRLTRNRLPATTTTSSSSSNGKSISTNSTSPNKEKTSAGTELSKDEERRTMRIERFQKKPISPPESSTTRNVVTLPSNDRKRTASETTPKDSPPAKRLTVSSTIQSENSSSVLTTSPVRPRFIPQPITAPSIQQPSSLSSSTGTSRPRQIPSVVNNKRPLATVMPTSSSAPIKPNEQTSINSTEKIISSSPSKSTTTTTTTTISNTPNEDDENQLLKLNDSADVVDTFALIDEALLEADDLLKNI